MRKLLFRVLLLLFLSTGINTVAVAQHATYTHILSTDSATSANDMSITVNADNSAAAHVLIRDPSTSSQIRYVLKADSAGVISWSKKLQQPSATYSDIQNTSVIRIPGGYFDCSKATYTPAVTYDPVCIRSDANGDPVWAKVYHMPGVSSWGIPDCGQLNDGSFVIADDVFSVLEIPYVHLMRVDSNGTLLWAYIYSPTLGQEMHTALAVTPAQCALVMAVRSNGSPVLGSTVIRVRANGSAHWMHRYLKGNWLYPVDIKSTAGDSIWILSKTPDNLNNKNPVIIKTDSLGQIAWSKEYAYPNHDITPEGCITTADNGLITFGTVLTLSAPTHSYLMKTDAQGNLVWARASSALLIKSIAETPSGGIAYVATDINNNKQLIMGRKDPLGRDGCDSAALPFTVQSIVTTWVPDSVTAPVSGGAINLNYTATPVSFSDSAICNQPNGFAAYPETGLFQVAPNPAGNTVRISGLQAQAVIHFYNSGGQLCMQTTLQANEQEVDITPFAEGLYFIIIDSGNKRAAKKLVIQR